jgi:hypothetical protein
MRSMAPPFEHLVKPLTVVTLPQVLEGVGLAQDENYSITQECYPYLAKRLFTDSSPRAQDALRQMLYGAGSADKAGGINVKRLRELSSGFQSYTVATSEVTESAGLDQAATQVADLLLAPEGNFIQQVLIEELAAVIDAGGRASFTLAANSPAAQLAVGALRQGKSAADALPGPLRTLLAPALLPGELVLSSLPLLEEDEEDRAALATANSLAALLRDMQAGGKIVDGDDTEPLLDAPPARDGSPLGPAGVLLGALRPPRDAEEFQATLARFRALQPGAVTLGARLASTVLQRVACRVEERIAAAPQHYSPQAVQAAEAFVSAVDQLDASVAGFIAAQEAQAHATRAEDGGAGVRAALGAAAPEPVLR